MTGGVWYNVRTNFASYSLIAGHEDLIQRASRNSFMVMEHTTIDRCFFRSEEGRPICVLQFDGEIEEGEILIALRKMYGDARFIDRQTFVLINVSGKEHTRQDPGELIVRIKDELSTQKQQPRAVAFFTGKNDSVFEDALIACGAAEGVGWQCKVFKIKQDAADWFRAFPYPL